MTQRSSTCCGRAANSSLTSMPLWPYLLERERRAASPRRSCARCGGSGSGSGLPWYLSSSGLGSNVSTCDGPPFMNRWTTCLALAGKCGGRGASGLSGLAGVVPARVGGNEPGARRRRARPPGRPGRSPCRSGGAARRRFRRLDRSGDLAARRSWWLSWLHRFSRSQARRPEALVDPARLLRAGGDLRGPGVVDLPGPALLVVGGRECLLEIERHVRVASQERDRTVGSG